MFNRNFAQYLIVAAVSLFGAYASAEYGRPILQDVATGIFSAIALIIAIEYRDHRRDKRTYGILEGVYKRVAFKLPDRSKTYDTIWKDVTFKPCIINLEYLGNRRYEFEVVYDEGVAKGAFYTDEHTHQFGIGTYQYITKKEADFGTYTYHVDQTNSKRLYVVHKNILPSGIAEGLEIWERT